MGDQKYLPLIFPSLVTCLLTKTRGVQDFLEEDKEKKWIDIPVPPTFYDSFRVSKVGNFTTGVGKVTNFIFTQLPEKKCFIPSSRTSLNSGWPVARRDFISFTACALRVEYFSLAPRQRCVVALFLFLTSLRFTSNMINSFRQ